jgi:hypothetical protein
MPRGKQTNRKSGTYDEIGFLYQRTPNSPYYFVYDTDDKYENGKPI